jgi:acyl transferase domain-containing protein
MGSLSQAESFDEASHEEQAIAIVGMSFRFPQGIHSEEDLWKVLMGRHCTSTSIPESRLNIDAFYKKGGQESDTVCTA